MQLTNAWRELMEARDEYQTLAVAMADRLARMVRKQRRPTDNVVVCKVDDGQYWVMPSGFAKANTWPPYHLFLQVHRDRIVVETHGSPKPGTIPDSKRRFREQQIAAAATFVIQRMNDLRRAKKRRKR